jgi:outer membrane receptor protein involved in Fe transport
VGNWDEKQLALFGNFSYDFNDQLSASFGARFFKYDQRAHWDGYGIYLGGHDVQESVNEDDGSTFSLSVDYLINDSAMVYGRFAQGFRLGRPVGDIPDHCDADGDGLLDGVGLPEPTSIAPDDLDSLEAGTKLNLAGGRLQLNTALFAVKWDGIPVWVDTDCGWGAQFNAGKAKSRGIEVEGVWAITSAIRANFAASWVDPELAEDAPGLGNDGDRLPGTPRYNLSLGIQGDFDVVERPAFMRADLVYVGEYYNNLQQEGVAAGDYTTLGLRGGVSLGHFQLEAYVNNATNEVARTWIDFDISDESNYVIRPRTFGLEIRYSYDQF